MRRLPSRRILAICAAAALGGAIALAGCTSSHPPGANSSPPTRQLTDITPIPGSSSTSPTSSPVSATTSPTTPPSSASSKPPPGLATCTREQLAMRVLRGGAVAGQEVALITFTNRSTTKCAMFGYPGVSLRLHNALLGKPAERSVVKPKTVLLVPGAGAETTITDFSSCQAPVSDAVRVYAPDQKAFVDKPLELRGCRLFIDPVRPSS